MVMIGSNKMKRVYIGKTYDDDCTSIGYRFEVMKQKNGDFRLVATKRSRWSGSRNEDEYLYPFAFDSVEETKESGEHFMSLDHYELEHDIEEKWEQNKKGYIVS
jgi:hypothetical protein